jgi:hypothetical protein
MIVSKEFPNKQFATKEELFKELKANKEDLIGLKTSDIKHSEGIETNYLTTKTNTIKSVDMEDGFVYAVINTTKYMDSHSDVHLDGIWNRSLKDNQNKVYYLADHDMSLKSVIAFPKDVQMEARDILWKDLGVDYPGETQALIFKVSKDKVRLKAAKEIIDEGIGIEHSVRMQYVKVQLAVNSDDEDFKEEKAAWDKYSPLIVNIDKATEQGYFWAVGEAKIYKEGSMVLSGSNDVTPLLQKDIEPSDDTQKQEADTVTSEVEEKSSIDWQSVINKF